MSDLFRRLGSRDAKPNPDAFWSDKWGWMDDASPADLLAAVRRGVESGTIKGERVCLEHRAWFHPEDRSTVCSLYSWMRQHQGQPTACRVAIAAVIPVSDGGSET